MPNPQRGLAPLALILIVAVVLASGVILLNIPKDKGISFQGFGSDHTDQTGSASEWPALWGGPDNQTRCQQQSNLKFTSLPVALDDLKFVEPIGELRESHIIPGDHGGFDYQTSPTSTPIKVFTPADGFLVRVEKHPYDPPAGYPKNIQHYHVYLEHSCTLFTGFVHLTEFTPEVLAGNNELEQLTRYRGQEQKQLNLRLPLKAGQQLGTAWSFGLLGWVVVDLTYTNKGYLNPQSYKGENWRVHSVAGLDYFTEPLKSQLRAKNPRQAEPRGGKIDFDQPGKLVGGWFEKGSGGFRSDEYKPKQCGNFPCPYWDGHLAFVYDYIDPTQLRVSIGHDWGLSGRTPFGVSGNGPDFAEVDQADGMVKYELVGLKDISSQRGYQAESALITENNQSQILGTLLVEVGTDGIKVEVFPGKMKDQVSGFTKNAKDYQR